jgi:hypothetical protein
VIVVVGIVLLVAAIYYFAWAACSVSAAADRRMAKEYRERAA